VELEISQRPRSKCRCLNTILLLRPIHDKPKEVKKAMTPNPAGSLFRYLALAYIHDKLVEAISSTLISEYRDVYHWLLATQISIVIKNYSRYESAKPLLDALCEACESDYEQTYILGNIIWHTL